MPGAIGPSTLEDTLIHKNGNGGSVVTQGGKNLPAVLAQMRADVLYGRPSNYAETLAERYRSLDAETINSAMRTALDPDKLTWLIVGDAAKIKEQLDALGMPVEVRSAPGGDR